MDLVVGDRHGVDEDAIRELEAEALRTSADLERNEDFNVFDGVVFVHFYPHFVPNSVVYDDLNHEMN